MTAPDSDLDALADAWLDGELDAAQWQALQDRHGKSLAIAEYQARERRAAVAALPRAELPPALRDRLLPPAASAVPAASKRPAILRFPWPILTTAVLAATLVIGVLQLREWNTEDDSVSFSAAPSTPLVAHQNSTGSEEGRDGVPSAPVAAAAAEWKREQAEFAHTSRPSADAIPAAEPVGAAQAAPQADLDDSTLARLRAEAEHQVATTSATTTSTITPTPADLNTIGPYALALVRREHSSMNGGARNGVDVADRRGLPQKAAGESAPARADLAKDQPAPRATAAAAEPIAGDAALTVVLYNRTVALWTIPASQVRIEALDATGSVIWSGRAAAMGSLTVPAGGFVSVDLESADWPPETHRLRARVDDLRSPALELQP